MPAKIDITGQRFQRLTVIGDGKRNKGRRTVNCVCDCGSFITTNPRSLNNGHTGSCGCLQKESVARAVTEAHTTHGKTGSTEYNSWIKMKARCSNLNDAKYLQYGERGITVCPQWQNDFECFLRDMGSKPFSNTTIDRIDVNGNYEPSNCRWASPKVQARNKRNHRLVSYQNREMPLSEACEIAGVNYRSALYRLNRGAHWMPLPPPPTEENKQ